MRTSLAVMYVVAMGEIEAVRENFDESYAGAVGAWGVGGPLIKLAPTCDARTHPKARFAGHSDGAPAAAAPSHRAPNPSRAAAVGICLLCGR